MTEDGIREFSAVFCQSRLLLSSGKWCCAWSQSYCWYWKWISALFLSCWDFYGSQLQCWALTHSWRAASSGKGGRTPKKRRSSSLERPLPWLWACLTVLTLKTGEKRLKFALCCIIKELLWGESCWEPKAFGDGVAAALEPFCSPGRDRGAGERKHVAGVLGAKERKHVEFEVREIRFLFTFRHHRKAECGEVGFAFTPQEHHLQNISLLQSVEYESRLEPVFPWL